MSKHSSGTWERIPGQNSSYVDIGARQEGIVHPTQTPTEIAYSPVCRVHKHLYGEGNAELIIAAPEMRKALENVLTWLTNANAMQTSDMVAGVFRALLLAGVDKDQLDKAAICILRGAASQKQLDDDGVRQMLAHHGIRYEDQP